MQGVPSKSIKASNYNTEKQDMMGGKHSGPGMMQQHTSPPPMGHYLNKMSNTEESQQPSSTMTSGHLK